MLRYVIEDDEKIKKVDELISNFGYLKHLQDSYDIMWKQETIVRMLNKNWRPNEQKIVQLKESYFTSLIIPLSESAAPVFFDPLREAYKQIKELVQCYQPESEPELHLDSAHITLRSILDFKKQSKEELSKYSPIIRPVISELLKKYSKETKLYAKGFFTNLRGTKGLLLGIKFFPSTRFVLELREAVKVELYRAVEKKLLFVEDLRPQSNFHTNLVHSTLIKIRDLKFPLDQEFVEKFRKLIIQDFQNKYLGYISNIEIEDIFIRNGKSDNLKIDHGLGNEIKIE